MPGTLCLWFGPGLMRISVFFYGCFLSLLMLLLLPRFRVSLPIGWQNLIITDGCVALHVAEMCAMPHTHTRPLAAHTLDACQTRLGNFKTYFT